VPNTRCYFVYILTNRTRTLYVGVTNNLPRRIYEHRSGEIPGFTSKYNIYRLVYFEDFVDIRQAIAREKEIKGWLRGRKIQLIESVNPGWKDLSLEWLPDR
jgi:putative endonuclease